MTNPTLTEKDVAEIAAQVRDVHQRYAAKANSRDDERLAALRHLISNPNMPKRDRA